MDSLEWIRIELDRDEGRFWEVRRLQDPKVRIHYEIHGEGSGTSWTIRRLWLPNPVAPGERSRSFLLRQAHRFLESLLELEKGGRW